LRQEYGGATNLEYYNPALHRLESTNLDRTLSSANSLALGLFPEPQRATGIIVDDANDNPVEALMTTSLETAPGIPVYSIQEENDVYLRAFRLCPTFHDNLQILYDTDAWKRLERNSEDLLRKLATIFPEYSEAGLVPLKDIWNVYDPLHVAVTECTYNETTCDALVPVSSLATALSQQDFAALELLTHQVEHLKFAQTETAGSLLGSNLLWKILDRAGNQENGGNFFLYSAHAPTMLGLLATLQAAEDFVAATRGERFVDYGSALIFEVYEETGPGGLVQSLFIQLKYKQPSKDEAVVIPLKQSINAVPCGLGGDDEAAFCNFEEFSVWAIEHTLMGAEHWCKACANEDADVCLRAKYLTKETTGSGGWDSYGDMEATSVRTNSHDPNDALILAATFLGGMLAGLIVMLLIGYICLIPRIRTSESRSPEPSANKDLPPSPTVESESAPPLPDGGDGIVLANKDATQNGHDKSIV
jgi:Histidine phosphatase superfamily (branch 2)